MSYTIFTDACSNLPNSTVTEMDIRLLPCSYTMDGKPGIYTGDLDSFDSTCFRICAYHFSDFEYFDFPAAYAEVTQEQVQKYLKQVVTKERCALSVIDPKEEKEK